MLKHSRQVQRLMFLFAIAGLFAVTADFACLEDVCADSQTGAYRTMGDIAKERIRTLDEALAESGVTLTPDQRQTLDRDGQLLGVVKLDRPVKHPNGKVEMAADWLAADPRGPSLAQGAHARPTTPSTRSSRSGSSGPSCTTRPTRSTRRPPTPTSPR